MFINELIDGMSKESGLPKYKCRKALNAMLPAITKALADGDTVTLTHLGRLETHVCREYMGHDPITGERYVVPEHKKVRLISSVGLKKYLKEND